MIPRLRAPANSRLALAISCVLAMRFIGPVLGRADDKPIEGVGPAGKIEKIDGKFDFTEGPLWTSDALYFSDIPKQRIYRLTDGGKPQVFVEDSKHANGLFAHANGEIYACQMDGQVAAYSPDGKQVRVLADKFNKLRFNAPNDLVIDRQGGVYFTDPAFHAPIPLPQVKTCVYYLTPEGEVSRLVDNLTNPNGVILSPDEKTLYVIPSGQWDMMAYAVESPGKLAAGRVLCQLKQVDEKRKRGGDGVAIDRQGNLYIASLPGVQVFSAEGKFLGIIRLPEQPSNATFGGKDMKTLFVTARTSVYKIPMQVEGHRFPAGAK